MSNEWIFPLSDVKISDIVIGRGAFGEVRVGTWRNIQVACKKLHSISSSGSSTIDGNSIGNSVGDDALIDENILKREIEVLSKLRHPNLLLFIGVCGSLTSCNDTIILTELMPCSLYDLIETQKVKLDLADILDLSIDIANGLHYLHSHEPPILHRDISSKNILLGSNGAKIADLGQAKLFGQSTISRQTGMPGAMAYSAPEVLTGKYSEKIDVFSYGILLIQMCINEYPRIDKREEQCLLACNQHNILQQLIENCISYQPSLRLQSFEICQQLLDIKSNDRYYPLIRKISPEKDISVLARSYMNIQINKHNSDIKLLLQQTNCRLVAEENRYKLEANKVDELTKSISGLHLINTNNNMLINQLTIENELYKKEIDNNNITINTLTNSNRSLLNDKNRLSELCNNYELQLAQKSLDINKLTTSLTEYRNLCNNSDNMLITIQQSEANLIKKNNELKLQLNMQVEYNSDLESRLEQTLTRWKHERDTLIKETERCNKLRNNCSNIIEKNNKLEADLFRYEERLKLYDDLPLPVSN